MVQEIGLKVSEAFQQDVGYGRARIDHQTRIDLDLSIGDVIEIEGSKICYCINPKVMEKVKKEFNKLFSQVCNC